MANWRRARLGDLVETQKGYAFKSQWYCKEGHPIVKVSNFTDDSVDSTTLVCIPEDTAASYFKYKLSTGDVVAQTVGSWPTNPASVVGKCVRIPKEVSGALLNQNAVKLTPVNGFDRTFLFYLLRNEDFKTYIIGTAQGAASQAAITLEAIRAYEFEVPELQVQQRLAGILSAYDALIENNQRRFVILERMARVIYHELITTRSLTHSKVGLLDAPFWRFIAKNVGRFEGTKRYYATADIEKLTIQGECVEITYDNKPSRAQKVPTVYSVWFARMRDTFKIAWYSDVNAHQAHCSLLSSGFAGFEATNPIYFPLLFLTLSSPEFHLQKDLFCTGATQMSLTNEGMSRIYISIPSNEAAEQLGKLTQPLLDQMLVLGLQIQNLRRTRDLLLPRLLSGQIDLLAA